MNKISKQDFESQFALGERLLVERRGDMAAFNQGDDLREEVGGDVYFTEAAHRIPSREVGLLKALSRLENVFSSFRAHTGTFVESSIARVD